MGWVFFVVVLLDFLFHLKFYNTINIFSKKIQIR